MIRGLLAPMLLSLVACTKASAADGRPADGERLSAGLAHGSAEAKATGRSDAEFVSLMADLSEPTAEFLSDNVVSNETSYLEVADALDRRSASPRVYLGVGPEQNFTYIARMRASEAFLLDLRRGNLLLHLLYKAAFEEAPSRGVFLALLFGRDASTLPTESSASSLRSILDAVVSQPASEATYRRAHEALLARLEARGIPLSAHDRSELDSLHRRFFTKADGLRFALKSATFRDYPTLRSLLLATTPSGDARGFLASASEFTYVKALQERNLVVPLTGNFAGKHALVGIGATLRNEGKRIGAFYVSNVEQYLLGTASWATWRSNVASLPVDASSVLIRAYLDQGTPHPRQRKGHRTTTTLHAIAPFLSHTAAYPSMLALATDAVLSE